MDSTHPDAVTPLLSIPLIELGDANPVELARRERGRAEALLEYGRQRYRGALLPILDAASRLWAWRSGTPYREEIATIAGDLPTGVWFMNLSLEWGCTVGVMRDPTAPGMRLLRTLDWPFDGLGRHLVLAHRDGPAGDYFNATWPGFVGVIQASAPGRFAIALNQAPLIRGFLVKPWPLDWALNRLKLLLGRGFPPAHLLRRIFETCRNYTEAVEMLSESPVALPVIFSIVGTKSGEGAVIERLERRAYLHEAPAAAANHWRNKEFRKADDRGIESRRRFRLMNGVCHSQAADFDWLSYPVVNPDTRLAFSANPGAGEIRLQGFEVDGPVTEVFDLALQRR